jgi:hypothetical protein
MNLIRLRDRLIAEGLAAVEHDGRMTDRNRRGSRAGFALCRGLDTPDDFAHTLAARHRHEAESGEAPAEDRREYRRATVEVEFVWEVLKVGLGIPPVHAGSVRRYRDLTAPPRLRADR